MKTSACSDVADYVWLTGDEASAILVELADDSSPLHLLVSKLRRRTSAERAHLLLEQVELRRRATAKFAHPERMFFTRKGLEQATDEWIAAYKSTRIATQLTKASSSPSAIADLCCGIGGDLIALTKNCNVVGVDRDPIAGQFAAVNSGATVHCEEVTDFDLSRFACLHIDPDRRSAGRRTISLDACRPDLAIMERLVARVPNSAVKLAPATRVTISWSERCELEWISRDRECRQLVVWHGKLARTPGRNRATMLSTAGGIAPRTIVGKPNRPLSVVEQVDRYVFDVDAAVLAAHLKGILAAEHTLSGLSNGPTYLTGPRAIQDAALSCFEVRDVLPFEPRKLAKHLAEHSIGRIEIKKRGVEIDLEKLRNELRLRGENEATLLITSSHRGFIAIVARRQ